MEAFKVNSPLSRANDSEEKIYEASVLKLS